MMKWFFSSLDKKNSLYKHKVTYNNLYLVRLDALHYAILCNHLLSSSMSTEVSGSLLNAHDSAKWICESKCEKSKCLSCFPRKTLVDEASVASNWLVFVIRRRFISFSNSIFITVQPLAIVWSCLLHSIRTGIFFCILESDNKLYRYLQKNIDYIDIKTYIQNLHETLCQINFIKIYTYSATSLISFWIATESIT